MSGVPLLITGGVNCETLCSFLAKKLRGEGGPNPSTARPSHVLFPVPCYTHPDVSPVRAVIIIALTTHPSKKARHSNSIKREAFLSNKI